jgi:hypothetical protein
MRFLLRVVSWGLLAHWSLVVLMIGVGVFFGLTGR